MKKTKLIRTSTIAMSLDILLKGQLRFLNEKYEVIAVSGGDEHLENVKNREGVAVRNVEIQRNISPLKDFVSLIELYKLFKKEKPLIVHSITPKAGLLSMIAAYFAQVPIRIHTFTGLIFPTRTGAMKQLLIFMDKTLCNFATNIYPEGQGVKNDLIKYNITRKPLEIIANGNVNGIDTDYFNPEIINFEEKNEFKTKLGIKPDDFVFIFIGRLVTDKGVNEAIEAFKKFKGDDSVKLLLVGPYEDLDPLLTNTLAEIEENKNIISVGFQKDVRPFFAIADSFVFPSYREGFPNVVLQAGAMGLPSIVTDINGSNEIIQNEINGTIIPVKDVVLLFQAMKKIKQNESERIKMSQNARQIIISKYQQKIVWEEIQKEYHKLESNSKKNV